MRHTIVAARWVVLIAGILLCSACREQRAGLPKPGKKEQICFECGGNRHSVCGASGCRNGHIECPGPCLKMSRGKWEPLEVKGHSPKELWQKFPKAQGGYEAWNQNHVGEIIQIEGGLPRNIGKCPTCKGAARIACAKCAGKGTVTCFICEGKAVVPAAWTAANNPRLDNHPDLIKLRDGRTFIGRIAMQSGSSCTIRTRDGQMIDVASADILNKPAVP